MKPGTKTIPYPFMRAKKTANAGREIPVKAELPKINGKVTGTEVLVRLENQLVENRVYILKTEDSAGMGLSDRSGNEIKIAVNFRAGRSYGIYEETGAHDVLDTEIIGGTLFAASGFEGIRIFDISNPANIHLIATYTNFAGKVQGLAKYKKNNDGDGG